MILDSPTKQKCTNENDQAHEKLASLPQVRKGSSVCALPELSTVTEVSETDDRQSLNSTSKLNMPFGVCHRSNKSNIEKKQTDEQTKSVKTKQTDTKAGIKLKFNTKRTAKLKANAKKKKNKLELEPAFNMSPIKEVNDATVNSTLAKRKRKLYSAKAEKDNAIVMQVTDIDDDDNHFKASKVHTPKYNATSYKIEMDIERDLKKILRQPRRKSPRTKNMDDIFNQLKEKVECPEPVKIVDKKALEKDLVVYNHTSGSEDEDFKRKKIEVQKRISSTTIASGDSTLSMRRDRSVNRINYSKTISSDDATKKSAPTQKRTVKREKTQPKSRLAKPVTPLIDAKMRDAAPEELNTSLVVEKSKELTKEPKLTLPIKPQMEPIPDETAKEKPKTTTKKNKKTEKLSLKKERNDSKSEVSIATVGKSPITAHGDSDEHPPNLKLLTEKIIPRDLDIEYMDQSLKDYFVKLRAELNEEPPNETRKDSTDSDSTRILNTGIDKNRSPVVSVARLSLQDISKWLPSRRNSDTDSSSYKAASNDTVKQHQSLNKNDSKNAEYTSQPESDSDNSPVQKIDKISIDFDFENDEDITTKRKKNKSNLKQNKKSNTKEKVCLLANNDSDKCDNLEELKANEKHGKKFKKIKKVNSDETKKVTTSKCLRSQDSTESNSYTRSPIRKIKNTKPMKTKHIEKSQENRKSLISHIRLFDDYRVGRNEALSSTVKRLESIISNLEEEIKNGSNKPSSENKTNEVSSATSTISSKIEGRVPRLKRKCNSPNLCIAKRSKMEDNVASISDSEPSVSSVNEWFRRNEEEEEISRAENVNALFRESIESVMEKLDTTLIEVHQDTTNKFIHMFVDSQKQLSAMKQERRSMYRSDALDVLAQVTKVLDEKFADMDRRSQKMDSEFMEQLKVQASSLIREDCRMKQAMVSLLREDLSATLASIEKRRRGETL